jgi:hypothetical protein
LRYGSPAKKECGAAKRRHFLGLKEKKRMRLHHTAQRNRGTASLRCAVSFLFTEQQKQETAPFTSLQTNTLCTMEHKETTERLRRKLFLVKWKIGQRPQFTINAHMP